MQNKPSRIQLINSAKKTAGNQNDNNKIQNFYLESHHETKPQ